jgi:nitroreductase
VARGPAPEGADDRRPEEAHVFLADEGADDGAPEGADGLIDQILARRSIRSYTVEPVSEADLRTILEAAMAAPSGMNRRPWHFVAVTDRNTLDRMGSVTKSWGMLKEAPLGIVACGDTEISEKYFDQDTIAAVENLLIAVSMLGLGGVWLGCHPNPERVDPIREILSIPETVVPMAVLSIGHPAETKEPRTQYDETRVHRNRWQRSGLGR